MPTTLEFFTEAQAIEFNFAQLKITVEIWRSCSLDNAHYEDIYFQVEHMRSAFVEQVRQFKIKFASVEKLYA
jgi:hypothetical protein